MKTILLLLVIGFLNNSDANKFRCDYTYFPEAEGWLKLHRIPANWQEARLRCHLEGGNLASPLNSGLRSAMRYLMDLEMNLECGVFTGIHATFSRGDFFSVEGVPLSKIPHVWAKDQPDNYNNEESCILNNMLDEFADVNCRYTYPYICYKKSNNSILNNCGTVDPEYSLDTETGSCYKFHRTPRTWSKAYMTCAAEGGYLTIINSVTEAQVIRKIFAKNPARSMIGPFWKDVAFVGFHDWDEHGEWLTIEGQTLQEAGYDKFSPGEPNNSTTGEYCGAVYRSALLDDLWCQNTYAFICEKSPNSLICLEDN